MASSLTKADQAADERERQRHVAIWADVPHHQIDTVDSLVHHVRATIMKAQALGAHDLSRMTISISHYGGLGSDVMRVSVQGLRADPESESEDPQ